jgi:predicted CopG family antitoxin
MSETIEVRAEAYEKLIESVEKAESLHAGMREAIAKRDRLEARIDTLEENDGDLEANYEARGRVLRAIQSQPDEGETLHRTIGEVL